MAVAIATDIGGTFTDLVLYDSADGTFRHAKSHTDPRDFTGGIVRCLEKTGIPLTSASEFVHGSTVAINTAIERTGAPTALVVTEGMRDVYEIGRGNRPEAYNLMFRRPEPLVPRSLVYEVRERRAATGAVIVPFDEDSMRRAVRQALADGAKSIAVCFLHSYADPSHEELGRAIVEEEAPGCYLSLSHRILREYREYERISTTVLNSYVGPKVSGYLDDLHSALSARQFGGRTLIMQSNGGVMSLDTARREPVMTMESGPVGGVIAAGAIAAERSLSNVVAFDMGGTTAKAALLRDGRPEIASGYYVGGFANGLPVRIPVVDVVEIGAGGGSIAHLDETGALRIGPQSAGGHPGPVCYGWGGTEPTVTDANAVLGRLDPERFLGGEMALDVAAASRALEERLCGPLGITTAQSALAIVNIAVNMMGLAVRSVSIERGVDPRDCTLVAFGGAGPLHACDVARELGIPRVVVPMLPGHFSALGMLLADLRHEYVRTVYRTVSDVRGVELQETAREMVDVAGRLLEEEEISARDMEHQLFLDLRYKGQEFTLRTACSLPELLPDGLEKVRRRFDELHQLRFGHCAEGAVVEIVNLRVVGIGRRGRLRPASGIGGVRATVGRRVVGFGRGSDVTLAEWPVYQREALVIGERVEGPAIVEEYASTVVLAPGDIAEVGTDGALDITVETGTASSVGARGAKQ